jgi:hypothetical protein
MFQSFNDRASVATTIVLEIVSDGDDKELDPDEVYLRIWRRLRDEFDDVAREMAAEQQEILRVKQSPSRTPAE